MSGDPAPSAARVYCYPVAARSKYVRLLFSAPGGRYAPVFRDEGGPREAVAAARGGERVILHVQWEELLFRRCADDAEVADSLAAFLADLAAARAAAIPIVWTVHNALPHGGRFVDAFLAARRAVAAACDLALVHGHAALALLREQLDALPARIEVLPHPSYLGFYEPEAVTRARVGRTPDPFVLGFGTLRAQKRFSWLLAALPSAFLSRHGLGLRISGRGPDAAPLIAAAAGRTDVTIEPHDVPDGEVPALLASATCVILPYARVLSSGVALSVLSAGGLPVATRDPAFAEMLPSPFHRFLFDAASPDDLRRAIADVVRLDPAERRDLASVAIEAAETVRPETISRRLGGFYDGLLARRR